MIYLLIHLSTLAFLNANSKLNKYILFEKSASLLNLKCKVTLENIYLINVVDILTI